MQTRQLVMVGCANTELMDEAFGAEHSRPNSVSPTMAPP